MKNLNRFLGLIFILLSATFFSSCTENTLEGAANNICECTQPIVKINDEIKTLQAQGKLDQMTQLLEKTGIAFDKALACTKENTDGNVDKEKLSEALKKSCDMNPKLIEDLLNKLPE